MIVMTYSIMLLYHWLHFFLLFLWFQSAQNLAQISDLQAQLEEAFKEKQEVQEKVDAGFLLLAYHWCGKNSPLKVAVTVWNELKFNHMSALKSILQTRGGNL